jgi:hypothetical protein
MKPIDTKINYRTPKLQTSAMPYHEQDARGSNSTVPYHEQDARGSNSTVCSARRRDCHVAPPHRPRLLLAMTGRNKKRKDPPENPGRAQMPVRLRDFSGLIFCYFFIKEKVVASAAISGPKHSLSCTTKRLPRRSTARPALAPRNDREK